ncbi:LuxR C-terminal-related transcriptional regulator [Streptomyces bambusae]|uniref:LuxR C-terminal-related transcriptional regulator n=1 Tax=Streptomyces bambusae TaxID=1550616 RepID=UPI001CFF20D5|nr:LuxR C-terminal-related transcriptional regulator [Streptomyces bambusae]MCB5163591.1 LuxR C-terminal-related transcriptional regulator [Streptomyces bambusae]
MPARPGPAASHPTPAQVKIVGKLAQGLSTSKAAAELGLSEGTVANQMSHGNRRAGVRHRHALVHACYVTEQLPRPEPTASPPGGIDDTETKLWSLALDGTYAEIAQHCGLPHDAMKKRIRALRARWGAEHDPHLIALGWMFGVLDGSYGTGGDQVA